MNAQAQTLRQEKKWCSDDFWPEFLGQRWVLVESLSWKCSNGASFDSGCAKLGQVVSNMVGLGDGRREKEDYGLSSFLQSTGAPQERPPPPLPPSFSPSDITKFFR